MSRDVFTRSKQPAHDDGARTAVQRELDAGCRGGNLIALDTREPLPRRHALDRQGQQDDVAESELAGTGKGRLHQAAAQPRANRGRASPHRLRVTTAMVTT